MNAILNSVDTKAIFEMVNNLKEKYKIDENGANKKSTEDVLNDDVKKDSDLVVQDGSKSSKVNKSSHHAPRSTRASRLRAGEKDGVKSPQGTPPSSRSSSQNNRKPPPAGPSKSMLSTKRTPSPASSSSMRRTTANSVARNLKVKTATETSEKKVKSTASSKELASSPFARRQARLKAEAAAAEASKTNEKGNADNAINAAKSS